jgi:enoyl-CoA hydratase/carnithine racemase
LATVRELALPGEEIEGGEARALELIHKYCPEGDLDREILGLAGKLSGRSPASSSIIKSGLDRNPAMTLREVLAWETSTQAPMLGSEVHGRYLKWFPQARKRK